MRRIISFFLFCSVLLILTSCNGKTTSSDVVVTSKPKIQATAVPSGTGLISLAYSETDSLNPYKAVTNNNRQLGTLLFDTLIKLDGNFNPQMELAQKITLSGKSCIIKLKFAVFSDGTAVGAEDVTYSLGEAKKSVLFSKQLDKITSISAASENVVSLGLSEKDAYFINLLDFPIYKMNSDVRKTADKKPLPPIGSGRYVYSENNGKALLKPNTRYWGDKVKNSIELIHTPDEEALAHIISVGGIDIYYSDLSDQQMPKLSGKQTSVPLTNLVYIGINPSNSVLNNPYIKKALANCIDREDICESAFYTYATPTTTPFPATFSPTKKWLKKVSLNENFPVVIESLNKAGYNKKSETGYYLNSKNKSITLRLLYNTDNAFRAAAASIISERMQKAGMNVLLVGKKFSDYSNAVTSGQYDLYLGEVKLNKNLDLAPLFAGSIIKLPAPTTIKTTQSTQTSESIQTTSAATPVVAVPESELIKAFRNYKKDNTSFQKFMDEYYKEMPFIPICYREGVMLYSKKLKNTPLPCNSDIFFNIDKLSK